MEMQVRLSIYKSREADGARFDGKHGKFTEVERKVSFNSKVSTEMECR